jgi:Alcohol dehydrogenase transcription factor Myb/SANT-like.
MLWEPANDKYAKNKLKPQEWNCIAKKVARVYNVSMTSELSFIFSVSIGEDAQKMWKALRDTFARIRQETRNLDGAWRREAGR